jgi:hypothetical protein
MVGTSTSAGYGPLRQHPMGQATLAVWLRKAAPFLAFAVLAVGVLNFLWFMSETAPLNLIPSDGRVIDGQYYLWSKTHGGYVAVSASFWQWVRFHEQTVFLSWPLVMVAGGSLVFAGLSGRIGGLGQIESAGRVQSVRDSGPLLASVRSAGVIGRIWFSRPLLRVEAYPGGFVIKPVFMAERAVLTSEVRAVESGGGLSREAGNRGPVVGVGVAELSAAYRPNGPFVRIDHDGVGMASPIVIVGSGNWPLAQALPHAAKGATGRTSLDDGTRAPGSTAVDAGATTGSVIRGVGRPGLPSSIELAGAVLSVVVCGVLLWSGITVAVPQLGLFGWFWTVFLVAIIAVNLRRVWVRRSNKSYGWRALRDNDRKDGGL